LRSTSTTRDRDNLLRQVTALEKDLEAAAAQARDAEEVLERLEVSQSEAAGRLALASRARTDLEQRLAELHEALRVAERKALEQAYRQALAVRDKAAEQAAVAIDRALAAVENLDQARAALKSAWDEAASGGARLPDAWPTDPDVYSDQWSRLEHLVREMAQLQLERDLVEAAATSPMGNAIRDLPIHLQQLARERRRIALRSAAAHDASETKQRSSS
jgi:hypothetical protein